jgi:RHS repeat-associated protein
MGGIDEVFARQTGSGANAQMLNYLTDALGSPIRLTDKTGVKVVDYTYDPYGNTTADATIDNPFQYTGRENDNTGLYYYRARYYSPNQQRFISEDPIGLNGGINVYGYVEGNPINLIDPMGLWAWGDPLPQGVVDGVAGFGDTMSFGFSGWARGQMGFDGGVNKCSGAYGVGVAAGIGVGIGMGVGGAIGGGFRAEIGAWKSGGRWFAGGRKIPHFHYGRGPGLGGHHLPYEAGNWGRNFSANWGRGTAGGDAAGMGAAGYGAGVAGHGAFGGGGCGCK